MTSLIQWPKSLPLDKSGNWTKEWVLWLQTHSIPSGIPIDVASGGTGLTTAPSNGQLLIGNAGGYSIAPLTAGTGVTVTGGPGSITVANSGVTSLTGTANEVIVSAATGAVTLSTPQAIGTGSSPTFNALTIASLILGGNAFAYTPPTAWTPTDASGAALSLTTGTCQYLTFGKLAIAGFNITYPVTVDASSARIGGLPATSVSGDSVWPVIISISNLGVGLTARVVAGGTTFAFETLAGVEYTNAGLSGKNFRGAAIYATT